MADTNGSNQTHTLETDQYKHNPDFETVSDSDNRNELREILLALQNPSLAWKDSNCKENGFGTSTNIADCGEKREVDAQDRKAARQFFRGPNCRPDPTAFPELKPVGVCRVNEIWFTSDAVNRPAEKLLFTSIDGGKYINVNDMWGLNSRWLSTKYKLLSKSLIKSSQFYTCYPIYRKHFILSQGTFGPVEIGFSLDFRAIAIKRLTENGWSCEEWDILQQIIENMQYLKHGNLLESFVVEDYCGHKFFYSFLCDYNLADYLLNMKETQQLNLIAKKRICGQMVYGLEFLHSNGITHGNLKPNNIFVDNFGVLKLAEFGIVHRLGRANAEIPLHAKIWWSTESIILYNVCKKYLCSAMSDVQVCGCLMFYITSGGLHPFGIKNEDIIQNLEKGEPLGLPVPCELQTLLEKMFNPIYILRPTIDKVFNHVFFWSDEKKWKFTKKCLKLSDTEYEPFFPENYSSEEFCNALRQFIENEHISHYWLTSAFIYFRNVEVPWNFWADAALGIFKYLNKCRMEEPILFNTPGYVLEAFPQVPRILYDALINTHWFQHPELQIFDPRNPNRIM